MAFRERLRESRKSETAVRKDLLSSGYTRRVLSRGPAWRRKVHASPAIPPSLTKNEHGPFVLRKKYRLKRLRNCGNYNFLSLPPFTSSWLVKKIRTSGRLTVVHTAVKHVCSLAKSGEEVLCANDKSAEKKCASSSSDTEKFAQRGVISGDVCMRSHDRHIAPCELWDRPVAPLNILHWHLFDGHVKTYIFGFKTILSFSILFEMRSMVNNN